MDPTNKGPLPERISNENGFLTELWTFNCPVSWAFLSCVKSGHLKTAYHSARRIHAGTKWRPVKGVCINPVVLQLYSTYGRVVWIQRPLSCDPGSNLFERF